MIYDHGFGGVGWNITGGGNQGVQNVAGILAGAGYVVMDFNNTFQNCYGNPQCVADTAAAINYVTGVLSYVTGVLSLAPSLTCSLTLWAD